MTTEPCPHCRNQIIRDQLATHIATEHADLPPCTAAYFTGAHSVDCLFRTPHIGGPYANYHMNGWDEGPAPHRLWTDTADGALPHQDRASTAHPDERTLTMDQQEQAAPVDWQTLVRDRERELKAIGEQKHATEQERDGAYRERAHLVAHLATLYPAHIGYTDPNTVDWLVVTIETPTGQMSWHIAERDRDLFEHVQLVPAEHNVWDGHTTEQKYARLRRLTANPGHAEAAIVRVIGLHERWLAAGAPPLGTSMARWWDARLAELHKAIRPPAVDPTKD